MSDTFTANASVKPAPALMEVTRQTYDRLSAELETLRTIERPEVAKRAQRARLFMAPSPDGTIQHVAIYDLDMLDRRIAELEARLARTQVIEKTSSSTIQLGSTFTVRYDDGTEETLTLVSALEADPARGYVASESVVGKALLGRGPGDNVGVDAAGETLTLTIDRIGSPAATD